MTPLAEAPIDGATRTVRYRAIWPPASCQRYIDNARHGATVVEMLRERVRHKRGNDSPLRVAEPEQAFLIDHTT